MLRGLGSCSNPTFSENLNPLFALNCASDYYGAMFDPGITAPPVLQPPKAPQTAAGMTNWTPIMQTEALASAQGEFQSDTTGSGPIGSGTGSGGSSASATLLWVLGGVAAVLFLTTILRK